MKNQVSVQRDWSPLLREGWMVLVSIATIVTVVENEKLTGEQKKQMVLEEIITKVLGVFNLPIPAYLQKMLLSPLVDWMVEKFHEWGIFSHSK